MHIKFVGKRFGLSYREGIIETEHIFERHSHPSYELIAIFGGQISIVIGDTRYELSEGEIAIIPPLVYHSVFVHGNVSYKRATVLFGGAIVPPPIEADFIAKISRAPTAKNAALPAPLSAMQEAIFEERGEVNEPLIEALLTQLLYIATYKSGYAEREYSHPTVKAAVEYIDTHISERITLDGIADALFVSKSTVSHLFCREMKISPKQYVLQKKLSYAARLISEGVAATEAARRVGYDNYANFYKLHKKLFGTAPTEGGAKALRDGRSAE